MRLLNFFKKRSLNPFAFGDDEDDYRRFNSNAGVLVNSQSALRLGAVYACTRVISETFASVPISPYKIISDKEKIANKKDPLFNILTRRPNPWMTAYDFYRYMMVSALLEGNGFARVFRKFGKIVMLVPIHPDRIEIKLSEKGEKSYVYTKQDGEKVEIKSTDMLHFKGLSTDGIRGVSVINDVAKQAVGLGLAQEEYGARSFGQRANIAGVLSVPGKLDDTAHARISKSWNSVYGGIRNSHKVAVLEQETKFQPISMTNADAQFIDARRYQTEEICRIFRVPPHKIMDLSNAHYNNLEQTNTDFYTDTIVPWATCFEQELDWILIGEDELDKRCIKYNISSLLRGDNLTRAQVQNIRLNNGSKSINEVRSEEGDNPIGEQGDVYRIQLNTGNAANDAGGKGTKGSVPPPDPSKTVDATPQPKDKTRSLALERVKNAHIRAIEDSLSRVCRREAAEIRAEIKKNEGKTPDNWEVFAASWGKKYGKLASESVRCLVHTAVESITSCVSDPDSEQKSDTFSFASELSDELGGRYGQNSYEELRSKPADKFPASLDEMAEKIERSVARIYSEQWWNAIYAATIERIGASEAT